MDEEIPAPVKRNDIYRRYCLKTKDYRGGNAIWRWLYTLYKLEIDV